MTVHARTTCLLICACLLFAGPTVAQVDGEPEFHLGFDGGHMLIGTEGSLIQETYFCTLTDTIDDTDGNAQGWSISLSVENALLTRISIRGTDAEAQFSGGFEHSELTSGGIGDCEARRGAISGVILSFDEPRVLPIGKATIARIDIEATINEFPADPARLFYVNGCQGLGEPVGNNVTKNGITSKPLLGELVLPFFLVEDFCLEPLNYGFSNKRVRSATPFADIAGVGPFCEANEGELQLRGPVGNSAQTNIYVNVIQQVGSGPRIQGWSLSVPFDGVGDFDLLDVTTDNTAGAPAPDGLQDGGFSNTELVSPDLNDGQRGAVSAVVLSFGQPIRLSDGTTSLLRLTVGGTIPEDSGETGGGASLAGSVRVRDGLVGSGQPVRNVLTIEGDSQTASNIDSVSLAIALSAVVPQLFERGNANNDGRYDIADPVYTINYLFREGAAPACEDAADTNDDGVVDLSDATFSIDYLFLAGPTPAPPFGSCDVDPTADALSCDGGGSCP